MKFFKSKRNIAILAQGALGIAAALWPQKFQIFSEIMKAIVPGIS